MGKGMVVTTSIKAFTKGFNPRYNQNTLKHVTEDIGAIITRNPGVNRGVLTAQGKPIAQITEQQFQAMANTNLVRSGFGNSTRIIDEFTGTTYYLAPHGQAMAKGADGAVRATEQGIWDKLLNLFNQV